MWIENDRGDKCLLDWVDFTNQKKAQTREWLLHASHFNISFYLNQLLFARLTTATADRQLLDFL